MRSKNFSIFFFFVEVSESESANVSQTQHLKEGRVDTLALTGLRGFAALHLDQDMAAI